jgi:hypothetical protein
MQQAAGAQCLKNMLQRYGPPPLDEFDREPCNIPEPLPPVSRPGTDDASVLVKLVVTGPSREYSAEELRAAQRLLDERKMMQDDSR